MQRDTPCGSVRGTEAAGCDVYYGVPYAEPASGKLRFARPQPIAPWSGVRDASRLPQEVPQPGMEGLAIKMSNPGKPTPDGLPTNQSEDALTLSVYVPQGGAARKAVMVWIHGGAFESGAGVIPMYDGKQLAKSQDVVVVAINYRLACFGFLYKRDAGFDANLGLHDQVAALTWVRHNIAAFGGDPSQVTVFGESAGGMSICALMASPLAKGLFRGAICQSGGPCAFISPAEAEQTAKLYAAVLGISYDELTPDRLRQFTARQLIDAAVSMRMKATHVPMCWAPVEAGPLWPEPLAAIAQGASKGITVMSGVMRDEYKLFMLGLTGKFNEKRATSWLRKRVRATCPAYNDVAAGTAKAEDIVQQLAAGGATGKALYERVAGDFMFAIPHERLLDAHRGVSYSYRMDWASPNKLIGAAHVVDIPFVFGTHTVSLFAPFVGGKQPEADAFSSLVMDLWGSFARDLVPSSDKMPAWPQHDSLSRPTAVLGNGNKAQLVVRHQIYAPQDLRPWGGVLAAKL